MCHLSRPLSGDPGRPTLVRGLRCRAVRRDDPVHFCDSPLYGPFWSVTRYRDIMTVDTSHQTYSSDAAFGGITLKDVPLEYR